MSERETKGEQKRDSLQSVQAELMAEQQSPGRRKRVSGKDEFITASLLCYMQYDSFVHGLCN